MALDDTMIPHMTVRECLLKYLDDHPDQHRPWSALPSGSDIHLSFMITFDARIPSDDAQPVLAQWRLTRKKET